MIAISETNAEYFKTIEESAFILALDDNEPVTKEERIKFGYVGDGYNRWFDKSIQYVVPRNGRSAHLVDHSRIDGISTYRLNNLVQAAINAHKPKSQNGAVPASSFIPYEEYQIESTNEIDNHILGLRQYYLSQTTPKTYSYITRPELGKDFLLLNSVPIKGAVDLTMQLASRLFHGYTPAAWEVLSVAQFYRGRTEIVQVVSDSMLKFIDAALNPSISNTERRKLLITAAQEGNAYSKRGNEGQNYFRLMDVLELMSPRPGQEGRPSIYENAVWKRVEPGLHLMMTLADGGLEDVAYNMFGEDSIWINYTVYEDRFTLNCMLRSDVAKKWEESLEAAAKIVRDIVSAR